MTSSTELMDWLAKLPADTALWIDEGGLSLKTETGAYFEIGGQPDPVTDDERSNGPKSARDPNHP